MTTRVESGDYVRCCINGVPGGTGFVLGWMDYGLPNQERTIALLGDEKAHGMPVNVSHLAVISSGHDVAAWRDRYAKLYPNMKVDP